MRLFRRATTWEKMQCNAKKHVVNNPLNAAIGIYFTIKGVELVALYGLAGVEYVANTAVKGAKYAKKKIEEVKEKLEDIKG